MPTKSKSSDTAGLPIAVEDSVPKRSRGRGISAETVAIKNELEASLKDGKARSFTNVEQEDRETWARKVRSAARKVTVDGNELTVSTIYDPDEKKLYWGPEDVIKAMQDQAA